MAVTPDDQQEIGSKTSVGDRRSGDAATASPLAAMLRRHDRDRFQTALFAPAARREALFALYAFNSEIARVRQIVSEPLLGRMRLEWWRENIATAYEGGPVRRHPVALPLADAIRELAPTRSHFEQLIEARERELETEPWPDLAALEDFAEASSGRLVLLALEFLGVRDQVAEAAGTEIGIAYALAGLMRALPFRTGIGRPVIPANIAAEAGLDPADRHRWRGARGLPAAVQAITAAAGRHLGAARARRGTLPHSALPALLPAIVAERSLKRLAVVRYDPFAPALVRPDPRQSWHLAIAFWRGRF